eukprot:3491984-Alexandrium_andersonii.AAC.1
MDRVSRVIPRLAWNKGFLCLVRVSSLRLQKSAVKGGWRSWNFPMSRSPACGSRRSPARKPKVGRAAVRARPEGPWGLL